MKGKNHSQKTKEKLREIGLSMSSESRERLRKLNIGKHLSLKTREKIGDAQIGRKQSDATKLKISKANSGENAWQWKGDNVSKSGVHKWIVKQLGRPQRCDNPKCIYPRFNARGVLMVKPDKFEWANIDHKYKRILSDWKRFCTPCHRAFDYENFKG